MSIVNSRFRKKIKSKAAFSLIELLVVVTIINLLSSVIFVSAASARRNQRMVRRVSDLLEIRKALEIYNLRNGGTYPSTCPGGSTSNCTPVQAAWWSECTGGGFTPQPKDQWIPDLVPQGYMRALPVDPYMNITAGTSCFAYKSTGTDYKTLLYNVQDNPAISSSDYSSQPQFLDPRRDGAFNHCIVDGTGYLAWTVYSEGTLKVPADCVRW